MQRLPSWKARSVHAAASVLIWAILFTGPAEAQQFGDQLAISTSADSARAVTAADLDGDGDRDVLAALQGSESIVWFENFGLGEFGAQNVITTSAIDAFEVSAADLDGDGDQDVVSTSTGDGKLAWYENLGGGSFSDQIVIDTPDAQGLFVGDVDGSGEPDILIAALAFDKVAWYQNAGDGSFSEQKVLTTNAERAKSVYATDLTGDGNPDVISAALDGDNVVWYENLGEGSFSTPNVITADASGARSVFATDLDGDGDADVLSGSSFDNKIAWYENTGGSFSDQQVITEAASAPSSVYATDIDGDGAADVLSASFSDDTIAWYPNTGGGSFSEQRIITTNAAWPTSVFAAHLNGDGVPDVLSSSRDDDKVAWYQNQGTDETSPSAPSGLVATSGDNQVDLSWDANTESDLTGYNVYRSTSSFQEIANATQVNDGLVEDSSYTDSGLTNGTEYFYRVTAVDDAGNESGLSGESSAIPEDQPPASPTGLQATGYDSQVGLGWDANTEEDLAGYNVYRATSSFEEIANATKINDSLVGESVYGDTTVTNDTMYFYRVTAVDTSGNESAVSNEDSAIPRPPPVAQTEQTTDVTSTSAVLNGLVDPNGKETEVIFEYYPTGQPDNSQGVIAQESPLTGTEEQSVDAQIYELSPNTEYTFKVIAASISGSDEGDTRTFTTASSSGPAAPTGLTATAGDGQVSLGWDANSESDLTGYNVYRSTSSFQEVANATQVNDGLVGEASYTDTGVTNGTEYFYRVTAVDDTENESGLSGEANATPALQVTLNRSVEMPEQGAPLQVSVSVSEGFEPTDAQLFYRQGGALEFQSVTLESAGATTYEGTVPGEAVTERGLEYYAQVSDGSVTATVPEQNPTENPRHVRVQVPQRVSDTELAEMEYAMVSVPLALSTNVLEVLRDDFGEVDRTEWRLLRWDAADEEYVEMTREEGSTEAEFGRGEAYWLISRQGGTFDVEDAQSVSGGPASITLPPGWTQLANPYPYPVAWNDIDGTGAVNAPVAFDPGSPDSLQFGVSVLEAWTGYWVFNPNDSAVQLAVPQKEAVSTGQEPGSETAFSTPNRPGGPLLFDTEPSYAVRVTGRLERDAGRVLRDLHTVAGVSADGQSGVGVEDVAAPPPIGDHLRISIVEEDTRLAGSLRPPGKDGYTWDLKVEASGVDQGEGLVHGEVHTWGALPSGFERRLVDRNTGRPFPIADGTFTVELTDERPVRHLRLIVGTETFAKAESESIRPDRTALQAIYPNPSRERVSVDYQVANDQRVQIRIYDVLGRRVKTLVDRHRSAGSHSTSWNTRSGSERVSSGTYFVRMKTNSTSVTRRVVIVR